MDGSVMEELKRLTNNLKSELNALQLMFKKTKEEEIKRDRSYFEFVKQDSKQLFQLIDMWYDKALHIVNNYDISVYDVQIKTTKENFEMIVLHSYYGDVRRRRYVEMNRSCIYVFDQLMKEL